MNTRRIYLRNLSDKVKGGMSELHPGKFVVTNEAKNRILITKGTLKRSIVRGSYIIDEYEGVTNSRYSVLFTRNDYSRVNSYGERVGP